MVFLSLRVELSPASVPTCECTFSLWISVSPSPRGGSVVGHATKAADEVGSDRGIACDRKEPYKKKGEKELHIFMTPSNLLLRRLAPFDISTAALFGSI